MDAYQWLVTHPLPDWDPSPRLAPEPEPAPRPAPPGPVPADRDLSPPPKALRQVARVFKVIFWLGAIMIFLLGAVHVPRWVDAQVEASGNPELRPSLQFFATLYFFCGLALPLLAAYYTHNVPRWRVDAE